MKIESLTPSFILVEQFTVLEAKGADAASFLHRLCTNHILNLDVGGNCLAAFLDQKGRLVAITYVIRQASDSFQLLTPFTPSHDLHEWLDQFLFAEDAAISDVSSNYALAWVIGAHAGGIKGPDFHFRDHALGSELLLRKKDHHALSQGLRALTRDEFETLRVAGQVPFSAHEINTNFNPLQLGLGEVIHWAKGCYIGQEVISRLESKEKAAKTLLGGRVAATELAMIKLGESVHSDGGPAGTLTSVAPIDLPGEPNILLVLKRAQTFANGHTDLSKVRIDISTQDA